MATIVDRPRPAPDQRLAAHHARNPTWDPPPHHPRRGRGARPVRHAGTRRRYVWRDLGVALLTLAAAAGVVVGLLQADPATRDAVLDLVREVRVAVRARIADLPLP